MGAEDIRYTRNRNYDAAIGLKIISYNLMVMSSAETGEKPREIMRIASCKNMRHSMLYSKIAP